MITAFLITIVAVAAVLIGWGLSPVERKHRQRKHGKRRPGTAVEVYRPRMRRVSLRDLLGERPVIRTTRVQGVHQPLSGDYDSRDMPGRYDPHYAWLASQARPPSAGELDPGAPWCPGCGFANYSAGPCEVCGYDDQNVPRPADEQLMSVETPRAAGPGHPSIWPRPSRNMSHDVADTIIDSRPRCAPWLA